MDSLLHKLALKATLERRLLPPWISNSGVQWCILLLHSKAILRQTQEIDGEVAKKSTVLYHL
jgi:hypothetical protein